MRKSRFAITTPPVANTIPKPPAATPPTPTPSTEPAPANTLPIASAGSTPSTQPTANTRPAPTDLNMSPCGGCGNPVGSVHQCPICKVNMHPFCGTEVGVEGFGQPILCPKCAPLSNVHDNEEEEKESTRSDAVVYSEVATEEEHPDRHGLFSPKQKLQDLHGQLILMDPLRSLLRNEYIYPSGESGKKQRKKDEVKFKNVDGNVVGKLHRKNDKLERYEVIWTATMIQGITSIISRGTAIKALQAYRRSRLNRSQLDWNRIKQYDGDCPLNVEDLDEDLIIDIDEPDIFDEVADVKNSIEQIEEMSNLDWDMDGEMEEPYPKYSRKTVLLNPQLFCCSPMKAFLRYTPLVFWKQVFNNM